MPERWISMAIDADLAGETTLNSFSKVRKRNRGRFQRVSFAALAFMTEKKADMVNCKIIAGAMSSEHRSFQYRCRKRTGLWGKRRSIRIHLLMYMLCQQQYFMMI